MTIVRHHHEHDVQLSHECCSQGLEDEVICGETEYCRGHRTLRNQIPL
jgi:hypothetical protein